MNNPNVLLIMTDQQRPDTLGHLSTTPCRTPNIDSLAAEGVSFQNAYTNLHHLGAMKAMPLMFQS